MTYNDAALYLVALQTNLIAGLTTVTRPAEVVEAIDVVLTALARADVAQSAERQTFNLEDAGSIPRRLHQTDLPAAAPDDRCATCLHQAKNHTTGRCRKKRCGCGEFMPMPL